MGYFLVFVAVSLTELVATIGRTCHFRYAGRTYFVVVFAAMVLFAGARAPGVDPDYLNYVGWLQSIYFNPDSFFTELKDPGFSALYVLLKFIGFSDAVFFCLIAFIALYAKMAFSRSVFNGAWAYFLFFLVFARFFIVHDMIQVRVGVAISLSSFALIGLYRGQRTAPLIVYLIGMSFHLSVAMFAPVVILLIAGFRHFSRFWLIAIPAASFFLGGVIVSFSSHLAAIPRLAPYINGEYATTAITFFSFYFLIRVAFLSIVILALYKRLSHFETFLVFMSVLGLSVQILLSWNDSLSLRFAELFGFFDMACFVMLFRFFDAKSRFLYACGLIAFGGVLYFSSLKLVGEYSFAFL